MDSDKPKYRLGLGNATLARLVDGAIVDQRPLDTKTMTFYSDAPEGEPIRLSTGKAISFRFEINDVELAMLMLCMWRVRLPFWRWN